MRYPLMSAMDLLEFMQKLEVISEFDKYLIVQSNYVQQPLYVLGKYEPIEMKHEREGSIIEKFVEKFQVTDRNYKTTIEVE